MEIAEILENSWPEELAELQSIEESLTCGICYEYMETVVMTPCSHNYCSLCIRRYLFYKTECPACFSPVYDTELRVNRTLENIKQNYLKVRDKLKLCLKGTRPVFEGPVTVESSSTPVKSSDNLLVSTPKTGNISRLNQPVNSPQTPYRIGNKSALEVDSTMQGESIEKHIFSPSTSGIASIFNPSRIRTLFKKEDPGPTVPCPVCNVSVPEKHINRHLDDCLKRESNTSGPLITEPKLKPIPKLVLNLMKDPELRRRLKEHGLSTAGDSKALKSRLNRFHIIYNAERDKAVQRTLAEIVKQCEEEELFEKKTPSGSGNIFNKTQIPKPGKGQNDNYYEANKTSFEKLIEQVKSRNTSKKKRNHMGEKVDLLSPNDDQNPERTANSMNDSDSGTSSLPRHSSEGPIKFLEVQYSGEDKEESCHENSESDSVLEEINCSITEENSEILKKLKENESTSSIAEASNETTNDHGSPVSNQRQISETTWKDIDNISMSSSSNTIDFEKLEVTKKSKFVVKKPRVSKISLDSKFESLLPTNVPDIQALDKLLENERDEDQDASLDISNESVSSNASKVSEDDIEVIVGLANKDMEVTQSVTANGDKENEPLCVEDEKILIQRSARKRSRPARYLEEEENTLMGSSLPLKNVLHDSTIFEVGLDGTLEEVDSPPGKILKRRRGRPKADSQPEDKPPETPKRILRRRLAVGESSEENVNNA